MLTVAKHQSKRWLLNKNKLGQEPDDAVNAYNTYIL